MNILQKTLVSLVSCFSIILLSMVNVGDAQIPGGEYSDNASLDNSDLTSGQFWAKYFGAAGLDEALAAAVASDGNYLVAGYTGYNSSGGFDGFAMKLGTTGNIIWKRIIGGGGSDTATAIAKTSDGGAVVAGYSTSFGAGNYDAFAVKFDSLGNIVWKRTLGGPGEDGANGIVQTKDGGYIIAGDTKSYGAGNYDVFVVKLNASANIVWSRAFGGSGEDFGNAVAQTIDGGYVVAGYTRSFGAGGPDILVIKLNASGDMVWKKTIGGGGWDSAMSVTATSDGGSAVTGYSSSFSSGGFDEFVVKLDVSGNIVWKRNMGGSNNDMAGSIVQTSDGGYAIGGYTASFGKGGFDVLTVMFDAAGNLNRRRTFGSSGDDGAYAIAQTLDGNFILAGSSTSYGAGNYDNLIIKLDYKAEIPGCNLVTIPAIVVNVPNFKTGVPALIATSPVLSSSAPAINSKNPALTLGNICP